MAAHKLSGNDILLSIGTNGVTYDLVVCLTTQTVTRTTNEIVANTKCGPDKLPGLLNNNVTFAGQIMYDPSAGQVSTDTLDDYWRNKTTIYWKMGPSVPVIGDVTFFGTGFIAQLDETYTQDQPADFTGAIGVYGIINKTTATS